MCIIEPEDISVPEIYCALSICVDKSVDISFLEKELNDLGIYCQKIHKPRCEPIIGIDVAFIEYEKFWKLDSALSKMFSTIKWSYVQLKDVVNKYGGEIYIDIAFCHYGIYPALVISGDNMKKIRELEANISIDPFDYAEDK